MNKLIYIGGDANKTPCKTCKWSAKPNDCPYYDYLSRVGHSRTIGENGKSRLPKRYCDKYEEEGNAQSTTSNVSGS